MAEISAARDENIDFLRGLALLAIVLAHVSPPGPLFQLRNFDVALIVVLSGWSYSLSGAIDFPYTKYVMPRILRLIVPTWTFLTAYFLLVAAYAWVRGVPYPYSPQTLLDSYLLLQGIGYVWIIRVFLLVAIGAPVIARYVGGMNLRSAAISLGVAWAGYQLLLMWSGGTTGLLGVLVVEVLLYGLCFSIVFSVGTLVHRTKVSVRRIAGMVLLAAFAVQAVCLFLYEGHFVPTQTDKYPPGSYYLSYALGISLLLTSLDFGAVLHIDWVRQSLAWLGRHTLWVYLWHILALNAIGVAGLQPTFWVGFIAVLLMSVLGAWIQERLVSAALAGEGWHGLRRALKCALG